MWDAATLEKRALAIVEKGPQPDPKDMSDRLVSLTLSYSITGDLAEAEKASKHAVEVLESALGPNDRALAKPLSTLLQYARTKLASRS